MLLAVWMANMSWMVSWPSLVGPAEGGAMGGGCRFLRTACLALLLRADFWMRYGSSRLPGFYRVRVGLGWGLG